MQIQSEHRLTSRDWLWWRHSWFYKQTDKAGPYGSLVIAGAHGFEICTLIYLYTLQNLNTNLFLRGVNDNYVSGLPHKDARPCWRSGLEEILPQIESLNISLVQLGTAALKILSSTRQNKCFWITNHALELQCTHSARLTHHPVLMSRNIFQSRLGEVTV